MTRQRCRPRRELSDQFSWQTCDGRAPLAKLTLKAIVKNHEWQEDKRRGLEKEESNEEATQIEEGNTKEEERQEE